MTAAKPVRIGNSHRLGVIYKRKSDHDCYILHLNVSFPVELTIFAIALFPDKSVFLTSSILISTDLCLVTPARLSQMSLK